MAKTPAAEPRHLRPVEVQRILGCGRTTVHDYEARGLLVVGDRLPSGYRKYRADSPALQGRLAALVAVLEKSP